jgi:hypothetical protein
MNCSEFDRWLDEGSPGARRAAAMLHAGGCARCARALEAERAVAAALRAEAAAAMEASAGFVARVMARVEGAAAVAEARARSMPVGAAAIPAVRPSWWTVFASDPISVVSVTLGISLAVLASWRPQWLTDTVIDLATRWLSLAGSMDARAQLHVDPLVWLSLGIAASPFLAWGIAAAWRRLERTLVLIMGRPGT